jgi:hypothetical protein
MHKSPRRDKPSGPRIRRVRAAAEVLGATRVTNDAQVAVAQGVEGLERSREWVCGLLPSELAAHVVQALERGGQLTVFTESAAWAGRLTLALGELRPQLAPRLAAEARITVRVMPGGAYRR